MRQWDLNISIVIDRSKGVPVYKQLEKRIIEEICRGRLSPGDALPGSRDLAAQLKINRKTVILAYDELSAQGWVASDPMRGTFVSKALPDIGQKVATPAFRKTSSEPDYEFVHGESEVPVVLSGGPLGSFDDGLPDARIFPSEVFARTYRSALMQETRLGRLYYGDPRGHPRLRQAIADMLNTERGLRVGSDNVCITRGSQMGIHLASRVLAKAGDTIAIDELTYAPAAHAFRNNGINVVPIRTDASGFDVEHLEAECRKQRVKSVYLTPHHHFPTTVVMPPERRLRLLSIAEQYRFSIVEDDYDHDYNFDAKAILPMAGFSPGKIFYVGSFSKILSPHLRLGYIVAPPDTVNALARQILLLDRQGDQVTELATATFMEESELIRHARRAIIVYRARRDAFANALAATFGDRIRFKIPGGGLAYWIEFANIQDLDRIELYATKAELRLLQSETFRQSANAARGLRLGFASKTATEAAASLALLHRVSLGQL